MAVVRFGAAKELITPDFPTHMIGFAEAYGKNTFDYIHDDLYVRALIIDDGASRHLVMCFDLLFHNRDLHEFITEIAKQHGVNPDGILVNYTHTHYAPAVTGYFSELADKKYEEFLRQRAVNCLNKCMLNLQPGVIEYGKTRAGENISRRKPVDGKVELAPNPDAPVDDEMNIFRLYDIAGHTRCILFSYSCHPLTVGAQMQLTAEFPGRVCSLLEAQYYGCVPIFMQAVGGDAHPRLTAVNGAFVPGGFDDIDAMSKALTLRLNMTLSDPNAMRPVDLALGARRFVMKLPLNVYEKTFFELELNRENSNALRGQAGIIVNNYDKLPDFCIVNGGVWQLAKGLNLVFLGGEACYDTKRVLRTAFPKRELLVVSFCDSTAYVPSDGIISAGGYEAEGSVIEYVLKGSFALGVDAAIINAAGSAFEQIDKEQTA